MSMNYYELESCTPETLLHTLNRYTTTLTPVLFSREAEVVTKDEIGNNVILHYVKDSVIIKTDLTEKQLTAMLKNENFTWVSSVLSKWQVNFLESFGALGANKVSTSKKILESKPVNKSFRSSADDEVDKYMGLYFKGQKNVEGGVKQD